MQHARYRNAGVVVIFLVIFAASAGSGCTALEALRNFVQAPKFDEAPGRRAEIRLVGPSLNAPLGGAAIRLWVRVSNPNAFAFTISTLRGTLFLQDARAATMDLPLGLPLAARAESEFPIDLVVSFSDVPALGDVIRRAVNRSPIDYRLDGTVGVDAGTLGSPQFGPLTLVRGTVGTRESATEATARCATLCYMALQKKAEEPVGVRELRQNLSVYLARLATGTVFRVTDRGRAVALLIPIPQQSSALERLIASGRATAPKRDLLSLPRPKGRPTNRVSKALQELREDIV